MSSSDGLPKVLVDAVTLARLATLARGFLEMDRAAAELGMSVARLSEQNVREGKLAVLKAATLVEPYGITTIIRD